MGKCRHFFAAALTALSSVGVFALPAQLPADEEGLAELLEARSIDTFQYEQLLAFYALPISVPQGELVYLAQVFPDIADIIPASFEELSAYRPFDNRQIQRFFNDYPALAGFEPILRFNAAIAPARSNSEVIVGINRSGVEALKGHRARFRRKGGLLSAEGALALSDSAALLQSRRVGLSYGGVSAHIGNFKRPIPGELAFGRFGRLPSLMELTDSKMDDNTAGWLYGGSGAWNGVSVDVKEIWSANAAALGASAFCHLRPAETGGGVGVSLNAWKRARVFAGFTGFRLGAEADTGAYGDDAAGGADGKSVVANEHYYAHLYAECDAKAVRAAAETVVPLVQDGLTAALTLRLNCRVKGASAEYRAIFYPAGDAFPMSRLKKQLSAEAGENEPAPSPIQKHAVKMTAPFISDAVKLISELDFVESGGVKKIYGQAEARARAGMVDVAVKHSAKIFTTASDSVLYSSYASVNYQTPYPLEIRAAYRRVYGYRKNAITTYALEAPTTAVPSTVVAPYIRGKHVSDGEYWLGVKGEFHLYQKTWTGITLETPVNVKGADNVYIKVSSSYSF